MIDIHTHILPGIDDGAQDLETSLALLQQEIHAGVEQIVLTPHFHPSNQELESFLQTRQEAVDALQKLIIEQNLPIQYKVGMEILYSTSLFHLPPEKLTIEGTPYILVEFSTRVQPLMVEMLFSQWLEQGYIPIIAHVERYSYVKEHPELLEKWVELGALAQANASSLIRKGNSAKFIRKAVDNKLIHFVASDAHDPELRPANMVEGLKALNTFFAKNRAQAIIENTEELFTTS